MPTELLLVRHGESEYNAGRSKELNSELSDVGREQSSKVAAEIARLDLRGFVGVVSPYRRARQTAAAITAAAGVHFDIDEAVREWGERVVIDGKEYRLEPIDEVVRRLRAFLAVREGERLLIVSHATPIAILTQLARGEEPITVGEFWADV